MSSRQVTARKFDDKMIPEDIFKTRRIVGKVGVELLEIVFHFFTFARFRRAKIPSRVTASSGSSPCSHFQTARGETSNSAATSACVRPRRSRSNLSCSEKAILARAGKVAASFHFRDFKIQNPRLDFGRQGTRP